MSEPVVIADADECALAEGLELSLLGRGLIPYPATPPPRPRPVARREMEETETPVPDTAEGETPEVVCHGGVTLPAPAGAADR